MLGSIVVVELITRALRQLLARFGRGERRV